MVHVHKVSYYYITALSCPLTCADISTNDYAHTFLLETCVWALALHKHIQCRWGFLPPAGIGDKLGWEQREGRPWVREFRKEGTHKEQGNSVPRAGIEPTSLAFQANMLPLHHVGSLMSPLYPHPPVYAAPYLRSQCRLLHLSPLEL